MVCVRETFGSGRGPGSGPVSRTLHLECELTLQWFKPRGYRHFDVGVNNAFALKAQTPEFVARHSFSPLLHYVKEEKRYKRCALTGKRTITTKERPIKYASHRDACILSWYAHQLNEALADHYETSGIGDNVIAYRPLGRSNYHFSAEALAYAQRNAPVEILAFDISGFFDTLDHILLKKRLKTILGVPELPEDWFKVFRAITRFHYVDLEELKQHSDFSVRLTERSKKPIASVAELKAAGITFHPNPEVAAGRRRGIPQGTPISAAASNLYMVEFDATARAYCDTIGAFYRRYSDDVLVICKPKDAEAVNTKIQNLIAAEQLEIQAHKTERTLLPKGRRATQYLGFTFDENGAAIRETSLARQWRKMRRAFRRTRRVAETKINQGTADCVYTKQLRRRFTHLKIYDGTATRTLRNFSSYARRSAEAFGEGEKITAQVKRFERAVARELEALKALSR